ncbi:hypothetical protein [Luteolibacter luteus]|uniref:Uncharacterized protein n=1 Tax=Luteolibacter luteus TaxID=2728835 RepID=A0A858RJE1_9BACT|nr:hypothetical protein [Luteolibacter luteus]QJE96173.1 hypothetical protein HHL09_10375 [Luteolibacter luteus]
MRLVFPAGRDGEERAALLLRLEIWEGSSLEAVRWQDEVADGSSWEQLRKDFLAGKALLAFNSSLGIDQATAAKGQSIVEYIYPTEYEPPAQPVAAKAREEGVAGDSEWRNWLDSAGKYAVPTSFETRNTGSTFEAKVQAVTAEDRSWDLALSFDDVAFLGNLSHGAKDLLVEMPSFGTFRTGGLIRLKEGKWRMLSVLEPPRGLDGKRSEKRWVTLVRIDPEG